MRAWLARRAAWGALALVLALSLTDLSLSLTAGDGGRLSDAVWLLGFSGFAVVGGLVVRHQPDNRVGWLFLTAGLGTHLGSLLTTLAQATGFGALALVGLVSFGVSWVLVTTYPLMLFPDGRLPSRRWRPLAYGVGGLLVVMVAAILAKAVPALDEPATSVVDATQLVSLAATLVAIASLVLRWRRSDGLVRRQLAWLAMGGLVIVALVVAEVGLRALAGPSDTRGAYIEAAAVLTLPLVTYVAIVRHRLFDIELVLRRSIVYTALSGAVLAAYAATLATASRLFDAGADANVGASLVASAVVAVALSPVKERLDRGVDRALFGDRRRPDRPLAALGARLEVAAAGTEVLTAAAETVRTALRVPYVRIDPAAVPLGPPATDELALDLVSHGRTEGRLIVGRRDDFDARDRALLADLARQVALVVRATRLTDDLRRSRERLVTAREQERLRLRRDLHDGLGPVLAGLTLQVDGLRSYVSDPAGAALLDRITTELRRCVVDVRRAVDGLRPADLDQFGLAGVVGEQARSLSASGVAVEVACDPALTVGPAVEVAAYRIVTEAMTNVVRHAGARSCWVRINQNQNVLEVRVEDDGRGLDPGHVPGVGLSSMRERADELGGTLTVLPRTGGGTGVYATIPTGAAA